MTIRQAAIKDVIQIARIHVESWRAAYKGILPESFINKIDIETRRIHWEKVISDGSLAIFVRTDSNDSVLGWAAFGPDREAPIDQNITELHAIYIDPKFVQHGFGTELLSYGIRKTVSPQPRSLVVWVLEENTPALRFYYKNGFNKTPINSMQIQRGEKYLTEIKLNKDLQRNIIT